MSIKESVFDTLDKSNAVLLAEQSINKHFKTAHWSNALDRVSYQTDHVHTLSFYLQGGEGSRRIDTNKGFGHAGSLCILPQHHQSQWEITAPFSFAHLYFSDESIKQFAATALDIDPRLIEVPELTFHDDTALVGLARQLFIAPEKAHLSSNNPLHQEQLIQLIFAHLLSNKHYSLNKSVRVSGGLSPAVCHRLKEYIHLNVHRTIHLNELAQLANLSEYHFLRMFKTSTGFTPNEYLIYSRVEQCKHALARQQSLTQVALNYGFSNQSHFNRTFKKSVGVTPGAFRLACK